jgi:hypothetical protein
VVKAGVSEKRSFGTRGIFYGLLDCGPHRNSLS